MTPVHIQFTRFSAFYGPLIQTIAGGYLKDRGLAPPHGIAPPGTSAIEAPPDGSAQVVRIDPKVLATTIAAFDATLDIYHEGTKDTKKTHHGGTETQRFLAIVASGYS